MTTVKHQFVKPPNASFFAPAAFEDKYAEASTMGLTQDEYNNSLQIIADVHHKNLKRVQVNTLRVVLPTTTASLILSVLSMVLTTQSNYFIRRNATEAMAAAHIALLVIVFVAVVLNIILIPLVWFLGFRAQRKIKEESKEALNSAADLESQKYNGVRFFMEYPPNNKGPFAFIANWMFKPTLVISTNDHEQPETTHQTIFTENAPLINNNVNQFI
jgi:NADH:ubiquinone oxidoreductase subunit 5 (subunit L)/multisubunit Na+/H+ antiporter MnhA subunit